MSKQDESRREFLVRAAVGAGISVSSIWTRSSRSRCSCTERRTFRQLGCSTISGKVESLRRVAPQSVGRGSGIFGFLGLLGLPVLSLFSVGATGCEETTWPESELQRARPLLKPGRRFVNRPAVLAPVEFLAVLTLDLLAGSIPSLQVPGADLALLVLFIAGALKRRPGLDLRRRSGSGGFGFRHIVLSTSWKWRIAFPCSGQPVSCGVP